MLLSAEIEAIPKLLFLNVCLRENLHGINQCFTKAGWAAPLIDRVWMCSSSIFSSPFLRISSCVPGPPTELMLSFAKSSGRESWRIAECLCGSDSKPTVHRGASAFPAGRGQQMLWRLRCVSVLFSLVWSKLRAAAWNSEREGGKENISGGRSHLFKAIFCASFFFFFKSFCQAFLTRKLFFYLSPL